MCVRSRKYPENSNAYEKIVLVKDILFFTDNAYFKVFRKTNILRITALNRAQTHHECLHVKYIVVRLTNFTKTAHEQIQSHSLRQFSGCDMHKDGRTDTQMGRQK